jgi:nucleotide-binding universal stress UspA family protein
MARLWAGSVADVLLRRLSVPLLLVKGYNAPADLTGDPLMRRVLISLDGSDHAEQILEPAIALANRTRPAYTLLRVLPPKSGDSAVRGGNRYQNEWDYLRRTADRCAGRVERVHPRLILGEQRAARAILDHARTHHIDLIAMATRGRGGLARLFNGSVADQVVRGASVPVLVYRPPIHEGRKETA